MQLKGSAFPPRSSERYEAELGVSPTQGLSLAVADQIICCDLQQVEVSVPVGKLPIRFVLPDGWVFVTQRTPQLSRWLKANKKSGWVDRIEANVFAWVLSAVVCLGALVGSYVYLLPWVSDKVAMSVPDQIAVALGDKVLQSFDEHWQPSQLSPLQQDQIRRRVSQHLDQLAPLPYSVEIVFRSSETGANAFALPGGKVVLLDQMVALLPSDELLDSVILHELGHIHHRHMLKKLVHSSLLSVGVSLMTGESSGVIDNLAGLGVFFLSNGHSREAELEADEYAKQSMVIIYGSSEPVAEMFELLSDQDELAIPEWLNSHPEFQQRIDAVRN